MFSTSAAIASSTSQVKSTLLTESTSAEISSAKISSEVTWDDLMLIPDDDTTSFWYESTSSRESATIYLPRRYEEMTSN